jgi:hypothetical protein
MCMTRMKDREMSCSEAPELRKLLLPEEHQLGNSLPFVVTWLMPVSNRTLVYRAVTIVRHINTGRDHTVLAGGVAATRT